MNLPDPAALFDALEATWPPAARRAEAGWIIRRGEGGGQRVSAATRDAPGQPDIAAAEAAMRALGQVPLFMIRPGDQALDRALAARGYAISDPSLLYAGPIDLLCRAPLPPVSAFCIWPPLAIQRDIWAAGGIGSARLAVMQRAAGPKTALLARARDRAAGAAFVALRRKIAMFHALEVVPARRREGVGHNMLRAAAFWAQENGARYLGLAVTAANGPANALYSRAGLRVVARYHYRTQADR